jgi:hypothetical protein
MTLENHAKRILALVAVLLLSVGVSACGRSGEGGATTLSQASHETTLSVTSTAKHPSSPPDRDKDADSNGKGVHDSDDGTVLRFGHPATATTRTRVTSLVRAYYAAAVAEDGVKACSLLYSTYAEAVPEDYGTVPPGPPYARGNTCPVVMIGIFRHFHAELAARLPKLEVARVRTKERKGVAILSFGTMPERLIHLEEEGHVWKVLALIDSELP